MGILKKKTRKICKLPELAEAELASAEMKSFDDSSAPTSGRKRKKTGDCDASVGPTASHFDGCGREELQRTTTEQDAFAVKLKQASDGVARAMLYVAKAWFNGDCGAPMRNSIEAKAWCQKIVRSRTITDLGLKDEARDILNQIDSEDVVETVERNDDAETEVCDQESSQSVVYGSLSNEQLEEYLATGDAKAQTEMGMRIYRHAQWFRSSEGRDLIEAAKCYKKATSYGIDCYEEMETLARELIEEGDVNEQNCNYQEALSCYKAAQKIGGNGKFDSSGISLCDKIRDVRLSLKADAEGGMIVDGQFVSYPPVASWMRE